MALRPIPGRPPATTAVAPVTSTPLTPTAPTASTVSGATLPTALPSTFDGSPGRAGPPPTTIGGGHSRWLHARTAGSDDVAAGRAVAFVGALHDALGLRGAARAEKEALLRSDPHTFFRALPSLFVDDVRGARAGLLRLAPTPAPSSTILVDFHMGNLGTFAGRRRPVWGPNDYDQAGRGQPELDLLRGATSLALLARQLGLSGKTAAKAIERLGRAWRAELREIANGGEPRRPWLPRDAERGPIARLVRDAGDRGRAGLDRHVDGDRLRRTDDVVDLAPARAATAAGGIADALRVDHGRVVVLDVAERLHAGGSSRGLPRLWALVELDGVRHVVEAKVAPPAALHDPHAQRPFDAAASVALQREIMGASLNPLTRAVSLEGRSFLLREVEPEKASLDLSTLQKDDLLALADAAGTVLARIHASDPTKAPALARWCGRGDAFDGICDALIDHADKMARHVRAQHAAFATP